VIFPRFFPELSLNFRYSPAGRLVVSGRSDAKSLSLRPLFRRADEQAGTHYMSRHGVKATLKGGVFGNMKKKRHMEITPFTAGWPSFTGGDAESLSSS
jgi:hypothetical protein